MQEMTTHISQLGEKYLAIGANPQGKQLYEITRDFLEERKDALLGEEKAEVIKLYINTWLSNGCTMSFAETSFASVYTEQHFARIYFRSYSNEQPMFIGFNLENGIFNRTFLDNMKFPSVNFKGSKFIETQCYYSHFEDCDFSDITTEDDANFNQARFKFCNFQNASLTSIGLCESHFIGCNLCGTSFFDKYSEDFTFTFRRPSLIDAKTNGLSEYQLEAANSPNGPTELVNVDNSEMLTSWKKQMGAAESITDHAELLKISNSRKL